MQWFKVAVALLPALALLPAAGQTPPLGSAPQLVLSTNYVPANIGVTSNPRTVEAYNAGVGSLNLTVTASAAWLSASVGALAPCSSRSGNCYPITISFNAQSLAPGTYTEYITVADPKAIDSPQQIAVNATVTGIPTSLDLYATPGNAPIGIIVPLYTPVLVTSVDQPWLRVDDLIGKPGSPPYTVEARALPGMGEGTYTGNITIESVGGAPVNNMGIKVTFTITSAPIAQINNTPVQITGDQGGPGITKRVPIGNIGLGQLTLTGATPSSMPGNFLSASVSSNVTVDITANPGSLAPGIYAGTVTVFSNAANNSQISIPVEFTVNQQGIPQISTGGIVDIATYIGGDTAQVDILAIFGDQLAPPGTQAQNQGPPPLATKLGNTQVLVNGVPAPLYFASPGQINFQLSYGAQLGQGTVQVVSNGVAGNIRLINVTATAPRILMWPSAIIPGTYGIIVNADGSLPLPAGTSVPNFSAKPAKAGDSIVIYCIGFGQTSPSATDGAAAGANPTQQVQPVSVQFGSSGNITTATSSYAGLTPSAVGLYQVNVTIPPNTSTGSAVPITIAVNGRGINFVTMAISQ